MSQFIPSIKPCDTRICQQPREVHELVYFLSLYFISLGTGGYKPCLESFGTDQFDDDYLEERKKMCFFNWWNLHCASHCGLIYLQDFQASSRFLWLSLSNLSMGYPFMKGRSSFELILQVQIAVRRNKNMHQYPFLMAAIRMCRIGVKRFPSAVLYL